MRTADQIKAEFIAQGGIIGNCVAMVYDHNGAPFKIIEPPRIPVKTEHLIIDGRVYEVAHVVFAENGPTRVQVGYPLAVEGEIFK